MAWKCDDCQREFEPSEMIETGKTELALCKECFGKRESLRCNSCGEEFPVSQLIVCETVGAVCGGCKQEWDHGFLAFLDTLQLTPRKQAIAEVFAAYFLIECGWEIGPFHAESPTPDDVKHAEAINEAIDKWKKWQDKQEKKTPWRVLAADNIQVHELLKDVE